MGQNASNVTSAKPKITGAIYSAEIGATLPTNHTAPLDPKFKSLGYLSEDGIVNQDTRKSDEEKAFGGDIVETSQSEKSDKFKFTFLETLNLDVLKEVYGADNVTVDATTGAITVKSNSKVLVERSFIIELVLKNGRIKRIVIPKAKVSEIGDITYADKKLSGFQTTLVAFPDADGNTHYEYISGGIK